MRLPDDKRRKSPVDRFHKILSAEKDEIRATETRKPPVVNLPRAKAGPEEQAPQTETSNRTSQTSPGFVHSRFLSVFWTIASIVSLLANVALVAILLGRFGAAGTWDVSGLGPTVLAGLYSNLERLDLAHITATIPVQTSVALNTSIPVHTTTGITLAHDVAIQGAHVKINTAGLNIDAPASITLPAGTALDVALDIDLPLQTNVPIALDVPVDIPVQSTDLHAAILGLQQTLKPLLCAASPDAASLSGVPICR
jgi:hypothetical protein